MRVRPVVLVGLLVVALPVYGSNMGLALRVQLGSLPEAFHVISLPYLFNQTTAEGLCQELGGSGVVAEVLEWDEAASLWVAYQCGSGSGDFGLHEGTAYGVRLGWSSGASPCSARVGTVLTGLPPLTPAKPAALGPSRPALGAPATRTRSVPLSPPAPVCSAF